MTLPQEQPHLPVHFKYARLLLILASLPALMPLWLIFHYGTNMPCWDQWDPDIAGFNLTAHRHELTFADFAAQHNEHRILLPRLAYFVLDSLTHWNTIAEMVAGWVVVLLTSIGILWLLRRTLIREDHDPPQQLDARIAFLWLLCNLVIFCPGQGQNWLWGVGLVNFMPGLFLVAGLLAATKPDWGNWKKGIAVTLCSSAATWSSGNGMVSWVLAGSVLAWSGSNREFKSKLPVLGMLAVAFGVNLALYFLHYVEPSQGQRAPYAGSVSDIVRFFFIFQGNSFAEPFWFAPLLVPALLGVVLILLFLAFVAYFVHILRSHRDERLIQSMVVWFAVAGYALLSSAIASKTRAGFGMNQAVAPRYVTFSLYLTVALVPLTGLALRDLRRRQSLSRRAATIVAASMSILLISLQGIALPKGISFAKYWQSINERHQGALLLLPVLPEDPQLRRQFKLNADNTVAFADALDGIGYLHPPLIRNPNAALIETRSENFADGTILRAWQFDAATVRCVGWATLPQRGSAASTVFLTYDNERGEPQIVAIAEMGATWKGVIPTFKDPDLADAGWVANIPVERFPPGTAKSTLAAWVLDTRTGRAQQLAGALAASR